MKPGASDGHNVPEKITNIILPENQEVFEHQGANGERGFTLFETKRVDGVLYRKATGHGHGSKTFDWINIEE